MRKISHLRSCFIYGIEMHLRFAAGKGSAFVVDIGQSMASITPVVDGFVLRKGTFYALDSTPYTYALRTGLVYSALPQLVQANAKHVLINKTSTRPGIELYPHQLVASKTVSHVRSINRCNHLISTLFKASRIGHAATLYSATGPRGWHHR